MNTHTVDFIDVDSIPDELVAKLLVRLLTDDDGDTPKVTKIPMGATRRNPDGYADEATYLAWARPRSVMRSNRVDRHSHLRWSPYPGVIGEILERKDRSWRGNAAARRQAARQKAANLWYGVPNLILG